MALPSDYSEQTCSVARSLEVLGERWTLLIVRDAFFGVRRFGDFVARLDIPRAVLATRLKALVAEGVLTRAPGESGRDEYELTEKGTTLRILRHDADAGVLDRHGRCASCAAIVPVAETTIEPGPGFGHAGRREDAVSRAIGAPRRLLEPVRA
jgi:DNA-binding HxlR family transcriptional regulator